MTRLVWRWRTTADPNRPPGHRITHPLADRFGHPCVLLAQGSNGNRLVEFEDGHRVVAPLHATRVHHEEGRPGQGAPQEGEARGHGRTTC